MFHFLSKNRKNISFPLIGESSTKSAGVIIEIPANTFLRIIINISPNLELISLHKSVDTLESIESSSIIKKLTSVNLFLKVALELSFKRSSFAPGLILRPE